MNWNVFDSRLEAFNASLVIIAGLLVSPKETDSEGDIPRSQWKFLDSSAFYLNMAIEALQNLDRGNRVVQRIVDYLSQLALAVLSLCEFFPSHLTTHDHLTVRRMLTMYSHQASNNLDTSSILPSVNSYDPFASTGNQQDLFPIRSSHQTVGQKELPMEIDLSEFTLDFDLDWITRNLEANR